MQPTGGQEGRAAGGVARAALVQPRKRGFGSISAAVLARLRQYFGPGFVPLAPVLLVPINTPSWYFTKKCRELGQFSSPCYSLE